MRCARTISGVRAAGFSNSIHNSFFPHTRKIEFLHRIFVYNTRRYTNYASTIIIIMLYYVYLYTPPSVHVYVCNCAVCTYIYNNIIICYYYILYCCARRSKEKLYYYMTDERVRRGGCRKCVCSRRRSDHVERPEVAGCRGRH